MTGHAVAAESGPSSERPPFGFSLRQRVDLHDTDLGAVVYYGRYPHYMDRAVVAYRRHLGIPPLGPPGHLFVVRSLEVQYRASARFDDPIEVFVRTAALGRTSHTAEWRIERRDGDGAAVLLAEARQVLVGLDDYASARPTRVPEDMAERIRAFEGAGLGAP